MDIVVTIPLDKITSSEIEHQDALNRNLELNHRVAFFPVKSSVGEKCYYCYKGFIRGFHLIINFKYFEDGFICETTGNYWKPGFYIVIAGNSWKVLKDKPPMKSFQNFRYCNLPSINTTGHDKSKRIIRDKKVLKERKKLIDELLGGN